MLDDLIISSRINKHWKYSGIDSFFKCRNKIHFLTYPFKIDYQYNSRGFRDAEWPTNLNDLKNSIWCVGESFTVGLGCPINHTWATMLQKKTNTRTINVSLDGASNDWISRRACQIINEVNPKYIVVHWTFITRRESADYNLSDEDRRLHYNHTELSRDKNIENFISNIKKVNACATDCNVIHSMICNNGAPDINTARLIWDQLKGPSWPQTLPDTFDQIPKLVINELRELLNQLENFKEIYDCAIELHNNQTLLVDQVDFARDGIHYGVRTNESFADSIVSQLNVISNRSI